MHKTSSQLSLGERMRSEIVASLIHNPQILFLDEPTIGLDLNGKLQIRELLNTRVKERGTTLFLTSHDTADIEKISERVLVLDHGKLVMDSSIEHIKKKYHKKKIVTFVTADKDFSISIPGVHHVFSNSHNHIYEVDLDAISIENVIREAMRLTELQDITVENPSMEEIIKDIYASR